MLTEAEKEIQMAVVAANPDMPALRVMRIVELTLRLARPNQRRRSS